MNLVSNGVFLDLGSVDNGDLQMDRLKGVLSNWQWYPQTTAGQCVERIKAAQVVVSNKVLLPAAVLESAPELKLIIVAATGTNNVDLAAAEDLGITVCNCRDYATTSVAQHVITLMLNLLSGQPEYVRNVHAGAWANAPHFTMHKRKIREAKGLNLGIIGHGVLGAGVAKLAKAMGMNVLIAERRGRPVRPDHLRFEDVISHADVISIHCPLTEETKGLFDRAMLQRMKRSAILINTARGGIVVEEDLITCLKDGIIAGAGFDVLTHEPPPGDHLMLAQDIPNLIVTPHNAWASHTARQSLIDQIARNIRAFERGQPENRVTSARSSGSK